MRFRIVNYRNNRICKSLEVSYIIREGNQFERDDTIYPAYEFDYSPPEDKGQTEINMNILTIFDFAN